MNQILPAILVVLGVVAGGAGGHFLRSQPSDSPASSEHGEKSELAGDNEPAHADDGHGGVDVEEKKPKGKATAGHGGDHDTPSGETIYYKFTREFVVPIMEDGRVKSLVIININLEADSAISQTLFSMEPKLRDNIMTTLIGLSNDGVTFESLTDVDTYESLRSMVLKNLGNVVASGIQNVLIVDIARQDL